MISDIMHRQRFHFDRLLPRTFTVISDALHCLRKTYTRLVVPLNLLELASDTAASNTKS